MTDEHSEAASAVAIEESAEATEAAVESATARRRRRGRWLIEWLIILLVAGALALVMRAYVFQTFYIPSGSMEPTLQIGDRIVVSKLSTELGTVHVGDILVFQRPPAESVCADATVPDLVKRVIAIGPTWIESRGNKIYVHPNENMGIGQWKLVKQPWTHNPDLGMAIPQTWVKKGYYYMLGDNEDDSCDSRYWGPLNANLVVGKAFLRIWPLRRFGLL